MLLHSPAGDRCRVEVSAPAAAALQVTLVRLPAATGRLSLRCESVVGGVRLVATARDTGLSLKGAAWELLTPGGPKDAAVTAGAGDWFTRTELAAGEVAASRPLAVEQGRPVVFKVSAVDGMGRTVAAWATTPSALPR